MQNGVFAMVNILPTLLNKNLMEILWIDFVFAFT